MQDSCIEIKPLMDKLMGRDALAAKKAKETLISMANEGSINLSKCVVDPLIAMLGEKDTRIRNRAVKYLGDFGDQRATGPLIELSRLKNSNVRTAAVQALAKLGGPGAVDAIIVVLQDADDIAKREERNVYPPLRCEAMNALTKLGDPRAVPYIIKLLDDPFDEIQGSARRALHRFDTPEAKNAIKPREVEFEKPFEVDGDFAIYHLKKTCLGNPLDLKVRTERFCVYCKHLSDPNLRDRAHPKGIAECSNYKSGKSVVNFNDTCDLWLPNFKVRYWLSKGYMLHNRDGWPRKPWYQVFDDGPDGEKGTR